MSDINPKRMIPLHVADQAVAACEKEIAALKAEVARLRKAGDALHKSMLEVGPNEMAEEFDHDRWWASYYGWQAAKETPPNA
jgi:L-ascorbate metabolism protein UlaG (beta-lactamase superfamily)